jgi:hypothetical protein
LATVFLPPRLCSPCVTPRRAESKRCGAEAHGLGRSRSDFNPTRRIARERAAGGNHVTAYEGRDIAGCWSSEGDDWALIILPTSKMVSEGHAMEPNLARAGPSTHAHGTVLVPGQLVSQTPNGAMHHRASEARSLYVMMQGQKKKKLEVGGEALSAQDLWRNVFWRFGSENARLMLQSAVLCRAVLYMDSILSVPRMGLGAEHPALT